MLAACYWCSQIRESAQRWSSEFEEPKSEVEQIRGLGFIVGISLEKMDDFDCCEVCNPMFDAGDYDALADYVTRVAKIALRETGRASDSALRHTEEMQKTLPKYIAAVAETAKRVESVRADEPQPS